MFDSFQSASYETYNNEIQEGANSHKQDPKNPSKLRNKRHEKFPKSHQAIKDEGSHVQNSGRNDTDRKYNTFSVEAKKDIPRKVKNLCRVLRLVKSEKNIAKKVERLKPDVRRKIIKKIIPQYKPHFNPSINKQMTQAWNQVKRLLRSHEKSEKRGAPILYRDELPEFRLKLLRIIRDLPNKSFTVLREKVFLAIREIRAQNGREMKDDLFKKHYWSVFKKKEENSDILDLWKKLPRSNASEKKTRTPPSSEGQSTMPSSPNTLMLVSSGNSSSEREESRSSFHVFDMMTAFDNSQHDNGNGCYDHYQQWQQNQFNEEAGDNDDEDAYKKKVFAGLSNGTFPWTFYDFL